jgi:hypothetical protein
MRMRIATWNLEKPRLTSNRKIPFILDRLREIDADVWVLTETGSTIDLSATHHAVASVPILGYHSAGENWTTVWSRWPSRRIETYDDTIAACAEFDSPLGPWIVYGTVLPYHADRVYSGEATTWSEHYRVIPLQGRDWRAIRAGHPEHRFCVAGDLNQSRDGRRWNGRQWYGTAAGRDLLTRELASADLVCVTEQDFVESGDLTTRSSIDHICLDAHSAARVRVGAWEAGVGDGVRLSDHNGVWVDVIG